MHDADGGVDALSSVSLSSFRLLSRSSVGRMVSNVLRMGLVTIRTDCSLCLPDPPRGTPRVSRPAARPRPTGPDRPPVLVDVGLPSLQIEVGRPAAVDPTGVAVYLIVLRFGHVSASGSYGGTYGPLRGGWAFVLLLLLLRAHGWAGWQRRVRFGVMCWFSRMAGCLQSCCFVRQEALSIRRGQQHMSLDMRPMRCMTRFCHIFARPLCHLLLRRADDELK